MTNKRKLESVIAYFEGKKHEASIGDIVEILKIERAVMAAEDFAFDLKALPRRKELERQTFDKLSKKFPQGATFKEALEYLLK